MFRHKEKISIVFFFLPLLLPLTAKSQMVVGIDYGLDSKNEYIDNAIVDREVSHENRVGLLVAGYLERKQFSGAVEVNPFLNFSSINPQITSTLDEAPQNRKDYAGLKVSIKGVFGKRLVAPVLGASVGALPSFPYQIKNYSRKTDFTYEWGLLGGLMFFFDSRHTLSFYHDFGIIMPCKGDQYDERYGYWKLSYGYIFTRQKLARSTFKDWRRKNE